MSKTKPPSPSSLGLFGRYDGNILGGIMIGVGMTLTGSCPGSVLIQLSAGIRSGWYVFAGGLLGGALYTQLSPYLQRNQAHISPEIRPTIQSKFAIQTSHALAAYELLCAIFLTIVSGPKGTSVSLHPFLGGFSIGAAQAASLILTGNAVGVSTVYEVIMRYFGRLSQPFLGQRKSEKTTLPPMRPVYFAVGMVGGGFVLLRLFPSTFLGSSQSITATNGLVGGLIMVLGARIAGGCTSGHGISGMSMLSISSIITVGSMFVGGISSALLT